MKNFIKIYYFLATVAIPLVGVFIALNASKVNQYLPDSCTRFCHDKGCYHKPYLHEAITGNDGLFGTTINYLHLLGKMLETNLNFLAGTGYGSANLLIFCFGIPLLHFMFYFLTRTINK